MRTITEFSGLLLQRAAQVRSRLQTEGVAAELLGEQLGAEVAVSGDRLARLLEAVEAVGDQAGRVRLVRVFGAEDDPKGAKKVGDFRYLVDLQPEARPAGRQGRGRDRDRGKRGGPQGGDGRGRGAPRGRGGEAGPPKPPGQTLEGQGAPALKDHGSAAEPDRGGQARQDRGGTAGQDRGRPPTAGMGWSLTRAPAPPGERRDRDRDRGRRGPGRPRPGRPGPPRGPGRPAPPRPQTEVVSRRPAQPVGTETKTEHRPPEEQSLPLSPPPKPNA